MEIITQALLTLAEIIIILVLYTFFNQMDGFIRKNKLKSVIVVFLYTLILTFFNYITFLPDGILPVFNLIFLTLLLGFMTKSNIIASFITSTIIFIVFFTIELIVLLAFMLILKVDLEFITNEANVSLTVVAGIIMKLLELLLTILLVKSDFKIKKLGELKKSNTLFQLMALQTLMIVIIILSLSYASSYKSNFILYNIFIVVVYILFLILNIIDFKERERLQAIQNRFKLQDEYIKNMENIINIIRREKHDFSNHLNTILAICTLNKPDTVLKIGNYIKKLSVKLINAYHFYNSGNDYVDGILAVKSNVAFEHGIQLEADFNVPLKDLDISDCDITSIIGNITDNAFEAITASGESEGKIVRISTYGDEDGYYISISNNGPPVLEKDLGRIFASGYSTKRSNKSDHGFGLYIVQQLIHRYNGIITVSSGEEKTEFIIRFGKEVVMNGQAG